MDLLVDLGHNPGTLKEFSEWESEERNQTFSRLVMECMDIGMLDSRMGWRAYGIPWREQVKLHTWGLEVMLAAEEDGTMFARPYTAKDYDMEWPVPKCRPGCSRSSAPTTRAPTTCDQRRRKR